MQADSLIQTGRSKRALAFNCRDQASCASEHPGLSCFRPIIFNNIDLWFRDGNTLRFLSHINEIGNAEATSASISSWLSFWQALRPLPDRDVYVT
jgi:hypothetical protein